MAQKLELIKLESTKGAPNSKYPVIIYRDVLPLPGDQDSLVAMQDGNGYSTCGFFGPIAPQHFHSNTHKIYSFVAEFVTLTIVWAGADDLTQGREVELRRRDVMVLPGSLHWDVQPGHIGDETANNVVIKRAAAVPIPPCDPLYGPAGPLVRRWHISGLAMPQ